jgi:preprotein translocase subunit SecA
LRPSSFLSLVKQKAADYASLTDEDLKNESLNLAFECRKTEQLSPLLIAKTFAAVQQAAERHLQMKHYDVQLLGGWALVHGQIAEMKTGEGKTLTATLPIAVHALRGRGALLATTNDYLARRDAQWMQPIYQALGMRVGVIQSEMSREQRRAGYQCDLTYGTMKEFGFDFLRDHAMQREQKQREFWYGGAAGGVAVASASLPVHRPPHFLLIDEADSILIDDARTPLIISAAEDGATHEQQKMLYSWSAIHAPSFNEDEEYWYDREKRKVDLSPSGTALVRAISKPIELAGVGLLEMYDFMERAIQVYRDFHLNRDYVVRDGEIKIVDEATGRIAEGRRWSRGIHQAIEAKEGVEITLDTHTQAKITVQAFVSRFPHICGMTGTAYSSRREFRKIYRTSVAVIPPHRPSRRIELPVKFALTEIEKFEMVRDDIVEIHKIGRPILIGTRSIAKSEVLARILQQAGLPHDVLNANQIEREAEIIAAAGQRDKITVATNMAGRGTDIKITEEVADLGGLHVIGTEMHDSSRIDQQLFGRCGRQGDPGSVQLYLSAEDKLLDTAFGKSKADAYRKNGKNRPVQQWLRLFRKAQAEVERQHYRSRRILMYNEKMISKSQREMGLDPILDSFE